MKKFVYDCFRILQVSLGILMELIKLPKTKMICTLGPSTNSEDVIIQLITAGMSIARLNFSHGDLQEHRKSFQIVRDAAKKLNTRVGILVDVPGPKYRTGKLNDPFIMLEEEQELILTSKSSELADKNKISILPSGIHNDVSPGSVILLNDGLMELSVEKVEGLEVFCKVIVGGKLTEKRGVATPGKSPSLPFPDQNAVDALEFAAEYGADFVALSTVTNESHVLSAKKILQEFNHSPVIISKIERSEALENFDQILSVSDAIMVARGDMGVEVKMSKLPTIQKELIFKCNNVGKPVITATQMLESMINSPIPTRAEVTDVANAIYDGTDAIMLSGETSIGSFPLDAVKVMSEIAQEAESSLSYEKILIDKRNYLEPDTSDAIAYSSVQTSNQLDADFLVAFTESGSTAVRVSKYRPRAPILALTSTENTSNQLTLSWGVFPFTISKLDNVDDFFHLAESYSKQLKKMDQGNVIVLVAGLPIGVSGGTNLLRVITL
ncbi:MAG: pyruvate kinase [Chloroflexi bacterium]|nr:pyruvate kinase [Chloroflexota bacterium]|tara:strand:- start:7656 stop:9143 length:1488 start_codon:yes stop_codon:yes gene_type:complete